MSALGREIVEAVVIAWADQGGTMVKAGAAADAAIAPLVEALSMAIVFLDRDKLPPEVVAKIMAAFASFEGDA